MERVVVLGCGGAGKTELALAIAQRTGLPVVHLDVLFWRPGWELAPREEAAPELGRAIQGERWILDGNFLSTGDARFERADTVIFLDVPRLTCLRRALKRLARDHGRARRDMAEGCTEGFSLAFLRWIWGYPRKNRPRVLALLAALDGRVDVVHLRSSADVRRYLAAL